MVSSLNAIQRGILQRLNAVFEEHFYESVPAEEFCSAYSLSRQQLEVLISPLVAEGWIEKDAETYGGYRLRFTYHGKREFDRRSGNRENERIRDLILEFLNEVYERDVNAITSSDDVASKLALNWNRICLN